MSVALVASTKAQGGAGGTSPSIDTTGANLLVLVAVKDGTSAPSISDSKGNTWTSLTARGGSNPTFHTARLYYRQNPTVGTGHTFTIAATNGAICVAAFSGLVTTGVFDQEAGAQVLSSTSAQGGSITPPAVALLISALGFEAATTPSIGSSYTLQETQAYVGGVSYGCALAWKESGSAENPSWSWSGNRSVNVVNASFNEQAAAAASLIPFVPMMRYAPLLGR